MALLYQTYMKFFPIPLPPPDAFKDSIAVVTGATSGLGLAAAIHFVNFGASEVIITSRNPKRSNAVLQMIEEETGGKSRGKIRVMELDMNRYESVVSFASELKKVRAGRGGIDYVLLNAGVLQVGYKKSPEGWEETLQANAISTLILAMQLLPWLKSERANRSSAAHLAFTGSGNSTVARDMKTWATWTRESGGGSVLAHLNDEQNYPGGRLQYGISKLILEYGVDKLAEQALGADGRPEAIMNSACPGVVATDLSRNYTDAVMRNVAKVYQFLFGKSPSNGARTLLAALRTPESDHGKFIRFYGNEQETQKILDSLIRSELGRKVQNDIWEDIQKELRVKGP